MARTRFRTDRGLTARMGLVGFLFVALYLGTPTATVYKGSSMRMARSSSRGLR